MTSIQQITPDALTRKNEIGKKRKHKPASQTLFYERLPDARLQLPLVLTTQSYMGDFISTLSLPTSGNRVQAHLSGRHTQNSLSSFPQTLLLVLEIFTESGRRNTVFGNIVHTCCSRHNCIPKHFSALSNTNAHFLQTRSNFFSSKWLFLLYVYKPIFKTKSQELADFLFF